MNDKEELARLLEADDCYGRDANSAGWVFHPRQGADAAWAAGWRKMPSREDVLAALAVGHYKHLLASHVNTHELWERQADAILALMGGEVSE